jgi:hypothetical protein
LITFVIFVCLIWCCICRRTRTVTYVQHAPDTTQQTAVAAPNETTAHQASATANNVTPNITVNPVFVVGGGGPAQVDLGQQTQVPPMQQFVQSLPSQQYAPVSGNINQIPPGHIPNSMQTPQPPNTVYAPPIANTGVMLSSPPMPAGSPPSGIYSQSFIQSQPAQRQSQTVQHGQNDAPPPQYPGKH